MNLKNTNDSLDIRIRSIGHVPAFKNKKIIAGKRLITAPKARKWMEAATASIYSQLKSLFQTSGDATSMEPWQLAAIRSFPQDDNWKEIPKIIVSVRRVPKGEEGANIKIIPLK